jgi:hypothetical protein
MNLCSFKWSSGASKPKNKRSTALQNRINTLYDRYNNYLITASELLNSLSLFAAKKNYDCSIRKLFNVD